MIDRQKPLPWLDTLDTIIVRFTAIAGGLGLAFMVLLTFFNVIIMRKMLNNPITGAEDLLILNLVLIVAIAIPFGGRVGAHIEIEIFESRMSPGFARWSLFVLKIVGIVLVGTALLAAVRVRRFGEQVRRGDPTAADLLRALLLRHERAGRVLWAHPGDRRHSACRSAAPSAKSAEFRTNR